MSVEQRRAMIEASHPQLSIVLQCSLLQISRSGLYYQPVGESEPTLALMRLIDEAFLDCPYYGSRQMTRHLHPYLLRDLAIVRPNQVWCSDITYIPMRRGFLYLVAIMDWHSRRVLSWRLSNTMDVTFCMEALEEALARNGKPTIFNTDQGSQFTSLPFTHMLTAADIQISMDGRGRWMDNVFIERLWRSLKYECVYLHVFETGLALHAGLQRWISHYNTRRPHSSLSGRTPDEAYNGIEPRCWRHNRNLGLAYLRRQPVQPIGATSNRPLFRAPRRRQAAPNLRPAIRLTYPALERLISRPSQRPCAQSQTTCVGHPLQSQLMCVGKCPLLRVGPFIIARRYI